MSGSDVVSDAVIAGSGAGELEDAIRNSKRAKRDRESAFASPTPDGVCSNCETKLSGPVCHSCGQTSDNFHRPVWELVMEVLDGLFGIEGRLWRTVPALLFQPGKLTRRYLSGVRARYVLPFRLYLTASVLFFLLMFTVNSATNGTAIQPGENPLDEAQMEELSNLDEADLEGLAGYMSEEQIARIREQAEQAVRDAEDASGDPVAQAALQEEWKRDAINGLRAALIPEDYPELIEDPDVAEALGAERVELAEDFTMDVNGLDELPLDIRRFLVSAGENVINDGGDQLWSDLKRLIPQMMFVMLPLYALILSVTHFYKRGYFFYDHLVVSLHFHAFLFFFFILLMGLGLIIGPGLSVTLLFLWSNYYLYRVHRVVYSHGRFSSILRTIFMDFSYLILLSMGATIVMFIAFLMQGGH